MNKTALTIGVLALVGVGAYFYFKPKASEATTGSVGLGAPNSTTTPVPPTGTQLVTPEQVEQIAMKMSEARELTKNICLLKKEHSITTDEMNDFMNFTSYENPSYGAVTAGMTRAQILAQNALKRKKAVQEVSDSIKKLQELGYKEDNCVMVKIA